MPRLAVTCSLPKNDSLRKHLHYVKKTLPTIHKTKKVATSLLRENGAGLFVDVAKDTIQNHVDSLQQNATHMELTVTNHLMDTMFATALSQLLHLIK